MTSGSSSIALRRSVSTASATPGYWTFTATSSPSTVIARWTWPIEAAANACSSNSENTARRAARRAPARISFSSLRERHRRHVVAERRQLGLELVALLLGQAVELDHRDHLADLHRRAAHPAELIDELVDERGRALVLRRLGPLGRAQAIRRSHPRPPEALPRDQSADASRPPDPAGRQLPRLGWRVVCSSGH